MQAAEVVLDKEELLSREAVDRPRAMWASVAAAAFGICSLVALQIFGGDLPDVTVVEALNASVGADLGRAGLTSEQLTFFDDHALPFLATAVLQGAAALCYAFVLLVLFRATVARGGRVPRIARTMAIVGGIAASAGTIGLQVAIQLNVSRAIADQDWSAGPAEGGAALAAQILLLLSAMGLAMSTVLIALAAMRSGLLTKFLGWLGVGAGAAMVLALASASGGGFSYVQVLWLLLVGISLSGRAPSGRPPAWDAGELVPWPSQQDLREGRTVPTESKAQTGTPSPATSKKKRKKRR